MEGAPGSSQRDFHLRAEKKQFWKLNGSVLGCWEEHKSYGFSPTACTDQQHLILLETREKPSPGEAWSCFLLHWVFWDPSVSSMGFPNEWLCGSVEGPGSPVLLSSSHSISSAQDVGSGTHGPWRVTQLPALSLACPGTRDSPLLCRAATAPLGKEVSRRLGLFVSWGS